MSGISHAMEYYATVRKDRVLQFAATWTELEDTTLSRIGQREKDQILSFIILQFCAVQNDETRQPIVSNDGNPLTLNYKTETSPQLRKEFIEYEGRGELKVMQ